MEEINTGTEPSDGKGDSFRIAFEKINKNFKIIEGNLKIKNCLKVIIWNELKDTRKAFEDVNYNFNQIKNIIKKNGEN